jgi:hypothetical protein
MLIFAAGAIVSLYQGASRLLHPRPLDHLAWNYAILVISALAAGCSFRVAYREFRSKAGTDEDLLPAIYGSKDPSTFTILFENGAALAGLLIAFLGLLFAQILQKPSLDAIASIGIALILMIAAALLGERSAGTARRRGCAPSNVEKNLRNRWKPILPSRRLGVRYHVSRTGYRFAGARRSFPSHPFRRAMLAMRLTASNEWSVAGFLGFATSTWKPTHSLLCFAPIRTRPRKPRR